jgi:hypothetical protein
MSRIPNTTETSDRSPQVSSKNTRGRRGRATHLKDADILPKVAVGGLRVLVALEGDVAHRVHDHLAAHEPGALRAREQYLHIQHRCLAKYVRYSPGSKLVRPPGGGGGVSR